MASTHLDRSVARLAADQLGVVALEQMRSLGVNDSRIWSRLRAGRLELVQPRVYRLAGAPDVPEQRLMAAVLSSGRGAVASHRAALWLWGLSERFEIEVSAPRLEKARPRRVTMHRSTDLVDGHIVRRRHIPVTTVARTLVDLGAVVPQWDVDRAIDRALAARHVTLDDLLEMLGAVARRGRRGVGRLRKSLAERQGVPDSVLDAELERLLRRSGIEGVVFQYEIHDEAGRFVARVDAAAPDARVAIEADGASTRVGRHALQYDVSRQNALVNLGWTVYRYTWGDVVGRPERLVAEVSRAVNARRAELGLRNSA